MNDENETRLTLINSAAYVVANEGYFRATTKRIAQHAGLNEVYIYRNFENKEDMIRAAFAMNDANLAELMAKTLPILQMEDLPWEGRCRTLFMRAWELMTSVDYHAKFYVRYYYSEQYRLYAMAGHEKCYARLIESFSEFFKPGEEVRVLLRFVFEATIGMVFRVCCKDTVIADDEVEHLFRLVYRSVRPCFREGLVKDERHEAQARNN